MINSYGQLFLEVAAYRYWEHDCIMSYKILDYIDSYTSELSRISDLLNVGVQVNAFTRNDLLYNIDPNAEFSDPKIGLKFAVTKYWSENSIPTEIEIGDGLLEIKYSDSSGDIEEIISKDFYQDPEQLEASLTGTIYGEAKYAGEA